MITMFIIFYIRYFYFILKRGRRDWLEGGYVWNGTKDYNRQHSDSRLWFVHKPDIELGAVIRRPGLKYVKISNEAGGEIYEDIRNLASWATMFGFQVLLIFFNSGIFFVSLSLVKDDIIKHVNFIKQVMIKVKNVFKRK